MNKPNDDETRAREAREERPGFPCRMPSDGDPFAGLPVRRPDPGRVLLEWARSGDGIEGLRARLHALGLVLIAALVVGCAVPERPLVRAARIYLDLAAPVSTLTPAQADRWRAGVREWQTEAARVEEDR